MKKRATLVYFIKPVGADGPIKIGCSYVPQNRLIDLTAWAPQPLELIGAVPGTLQDEGFLHRCFADLHSHREWFRADPRLTSAIKSILSAGNLDAARSSLTPCGKIRPSTRPAWTEDRRKRRSYSSRVLRAEKTLRAKDEKGAWHAPYDISAIFSRWDRGTTPSQVELARIEEYLAEPAAHSVVPSWRLPKDPICIPVFGQEIGA